MSRLAKTLSIITFLLFTLVTISAKDNNRVFLNYHQNVGEIIIQVSDGEYIITPFTKKAFHILFKPKGSTLEYSSTVITQKPQNVKFKIVNNTNIVKIESNALKVIINKSPFNISFYNHTKLLFSEKQDSVSTSTIKFNIIKDEIFYGGGIQNLNMNRRGNILNIYNKNNYALPIIISSKKYALIFDNKQPKYIDIDSKNNNTIEYTTESGLINYYVIIGKDWFDLSEQYSHITGYQPLPSMKMLLGVNNKNIINIKEQKISKQKLTETIYNDSIQTSATKRHSLLINTAFTGGQKYGLMPYINDSIKNWNDFNKQTLVLLQMGMQGLAYTNYKPCNDNNFLNNRILQNSIFSPIYYTQKDTFNNNLRHKLLLYIYTTAFINNQKGIPFTYPIFYLEPKNNSLLEYSKSYMWGEAFMIHPIIKPNIDSVNIYFPKGNSWTNFFNSKIYSGGETTNIKIEKEQLPVFIKGGTFIPIISPLTDINNFELNTFEMHYYADKSVLNSSFNLYNDDGKTYNNFKDGRYEIIYFKARNSEKILFINIERENGKKNNKIVENQIKFVIHNITEKPRKVLINGEKCLNKPIFNSNNNTVSFTTNLRNYVKKIEFHY